MDNRRYKMVPRVGNGHSQKNRDDLIFSYSTDKNQSKNPEMALRESEANYRFITENMDETIWLLDMDLKTKYLSPSISRYSGYSYEEARKLSLIDFLTPETRERMQHLMAKELTPERLADKDCHITASMDAAYYKKDRSIDWVEVTTTLIRDPKGKPESLLCVARNISDRRIMEEALHQSEKKWQFALEGSGVGVWDWNISTDEVDYSQRVKELFGCVSTKDWQTRSGWNARIHPEDREIVVAKIKRYLDGVDSVYSMEYRFKLPDNSYEWILDRGMITEKDNNGKPIRMIGTFSDITESRKMQEILAENEEKFRSLAERSTDIIALHEVNGAYKYVSPASHELLGFLPDEMVGQAITKFIHPEDHTLVNYVIEHVAEMDEIQPMEYRMRTKNGNYLWMETTAQVIRAVDTGAPSELQTTSRNITERVKAEEALRESELKLRSVITQSQDGITLIDEEGKIIEWSKGLEKISGIQGYQAIGKYIWDVQPRLMPEFHLSPEKLSGFKESTLKMLAKGSLSFGEGIQESTLVDVEGRCHTIQTLSFPIHTSRGYMAGSVIRDVTIMKKAEEALYKSEEQLRFITDNMVDMITYINAETVLEYVSPSVTPITGFRAEELIGLKITEFIYPLDLQGLESEIEKSISEKKQNIQIEFRYKHKEGHYICMEANVNLLLDKDGKFAGAIFGSRDISEKKRALSALKDSESRYRTLVKNFPNGAVMLFDKDLRYKVADGSGLPQINLSSEQLEGRTIFDIYTPETIAVLEPYYRAVLNGRSENFELPINDVTYEVYAVPIKNEAGEITYGMVMTQDVTERKQAVIALRSRAQYLSILNEITRIALEESDLQQMMQQIVDLLALMFQADHCYITSWNPESKQPTPLAAYGPMRENYTQIHAEPDERTLTESVLEAGTPIIVPDLSDSMAISPSLAKKFPTRSMLALPLIGGGEELGAIMIGFKDPHAFTVDEMNRAEQVAGEIALSMYKVKLLEEVQKNNMQLENRVEERTADLEAKNRELETFTYSVSHDLKAPLRGIDGYSRLLMEDHASQLDAEGLSFLKTIRSATKQMNQLIEDLLSYSRLERRALTTDRVDIPNLVQNLVMERKEDIARNHIEVEETIPPMEISTDGKALEQAMRNLIDNAIKFASGNPEPRIKIGFSRNGGNSTILFVEDNGIGFDMKYKDRIFDIFQRLHLPEEYPGTGIGLALVKKAMARIGGKAWAESQPGEGAKFYLEFPG